MASVFPFRALRPTVASAARVAAVPYDVVSADEARELAGGNPLSFLHVSRSEIDLPPGTDPYADLVYRTAAERFDALKRSAPLVLEETPGVYFYRLTMGVHEQTGLAACYSMDEYDRDLIKKHERTRRDKEDDRTKHMLALRAQTGPVFLTYRARVEIDDCAGRAGQAAPLFDFVAPDAVRHTIWRVDGADLDRIVQSFASVPFLYIADGHHRAASAARVRQQIGGEADTFLAVAFPHDQTQILPYNRVVKDLAGLSGDQFLAEVSARCTVAAGPAAPARSGEMGMYLAGRWYTVTFGASATPASGVIASLDVSRLQQRLLEPVLKIADVRTDNRIDFVGGGRGTGALERMVDGGHAAVAFCLYPVSVQDLMQVADEGGIMPPKSTWFEPKLRDGLLSHVI